MEEITQQLNAERRHNFSPTKKQRMPLKYEIRSRRDLVQIIHCVKKCLEKGVLSESSYWPEGRVRLHFPPFKDLPVNGPWPDYLEYYFEEPSTGRCFRLVCETYHGYGGKWEVCDHKPE